MYFKPFATKEEAVDHILKGKPETCQDRLESHFLQALGDGLDHNQAAERAVLLHAHKDHGQWVVDSDPDFPFTTGEEVKQQYIDMLMGSNFDGRAEERIDLVTETFDRYLSWGVTLEAAADAAWIWSANKWTVENVANSDLN